jgi:hypothetical protein
MIDSGATALFADIQFVKRHRITTFPLRHPIVLHNIDGSRNSAGNITRFARLHLKVGVYEGYEDFLVSDLGGENVILRLPWLRAANPQINWKTGLVRLNPKVSVEEVEEEETISAAAPLPTNGPLLEEIRATVPETTLPPTPPAPEPFTATEVTVMYADDSIAFVTTPDGIIGTITPQTTTGKTSDEESPQNTETLLQRICTNRQLRRRWLRSGVISDLKEEVWCAAGFTYSQKIAEEVNKQKESKPLEEIVPD